MSANKAADLIVLWEEEAKKLGLNTHDPSDMVSFLGAKLATVIVRLEALEQDPLRIAGL